MKDLKPIISYLKARDAWSEGQHELAAAALEEALGSPLSPTIQGNLNVLFNPATPAGRGMLILVSPTWRKHGGTKAG